MLLAFIASMALLLSSGAEPGKTLSMAGVSATADVHPPSPVARYDAQAEQELLTLTNHERERVGVHPLQIDPNLTAAARAHAVAMARQHQLSHQLAGEAPLQQRLATTALHLDHAGENVALDVDVEQAHDGLMHSPHHRENLLQADYNVVGFGIARVGDEIYVVEDFGHSLPAYAAADAENAVAAAITRARWQVRQPELRRIQLSNLRSAACRMATEDRLDPKEVKAFGPLRSVLTYTNSEPDNLPGSAEQVLRDRNLRSYAVGTCYAQTPSYPNGAYFVTLALY
ncbi:MAG TPA: CAP domain-containing protein [Terriglobales bacterium]|nr:CAP domain-containing protein [Terriglobales bacterium]